ncbi:hypothetical protein ACRQ5Q_11875 [Bradyrhizobium sp. PMVTL-01]|uniref:hypothetical protein n=1 Tax=Bradyrhizobium sp. PMVTL-01 TaxID=3434999 RepID=UPI003F6E6B0C
MTSEPHSRLGGNSDLGNAKTSFDLERRNRVELVHRASARSSAPNIACSFRQRPLAVKVIVREQRSHAEQNHAANPDEGGGGQISRSADTNRAREWLD